MSRWFQAVVFDLDGTLLDSLADIGRSANRVLEQRGCPPHPLDSYRQFIGDGVPTLFQRSLPEDQRRPDVIAACIGEFREVYSDWWNGFSRPYDGIAELLDALTARGVKLAVLSNKPDEFTRRCVDEYFSARWRFEVVLGAREGVPRKPDPAGALEIIERLGIAAEQFLYLGDSAVDMRTARGAGMRAIGAAWGYRSVNELWSAGAEAVVNRPLELLEIVDGTRRLASEAGVATRRQP